MDLIVHAALTDSRAVIFDWDGTLADTHDRNYRSLCAALAPHHITVDPDWYRQHCGLAIRDLLALAQAQDPFPIEQVLATSRAHLVAATTPDTLVPIPAAVDLARHARAAGLPCAVASGAAAVLIDAGLDALAYARSSRLWSLARTSSTASPPPTPSWRPPAASASPPMPRRRGRPRRHRRSPPGRDAGAARPRRPPRLAARRPPRV